jgi:hypothetical protein
MFNLSKAGKITRVINGTAAGTTDISGTVLDMKGYDSVMFVALFGALTATQVTLLKVQQGQQAGGGDMADLKDSAVGPLADADGNKCLVLDIHKPRERYVRCVVDRGTANAVIDGVIAIQYNADQEPVTHDATVKAAEFHHAPAEGTA